MRAFGIMIVAAAALAGCSAGEDSTAAKAEVAKFRGQVAAGQFGDIYKGSTDDIKKGVTEEQFDQMVGGFHRAIGAFKSAPEPGWKYDTDSNGERVTLDYDSIFERGKAHEQFIYKILDGKPVLAGYDYKADPATAAALSAAQQNATEQAPAEGGEGEGEAEGT